MKKDFAAARQLLDDFQYRKHFIFVRLEHLALTAVELVLPLCWPLNALLSVQILTIGDVSPDDTTKPKQLWL
jgi:hypothetical protein